MRLEPGTGRWALALGAAALAAAGCGKAEYVQMDPPQLSFKRKGEKVWARAIAKDRRGNVYPRQPVVWSSTDPKVATVDSVGHVEAVGPGRASVVVKLGTDMMGELPVEVVSVARVEVEPKEIELEQGGEGAKLEVKVIDTDGRDATKERIPMARCMDELVCRTGDRTVVPVDPGKTTLTVSSEGVKTEVRVTVKEKQKEAPKGKKKP